MSLIERENRLLRCLHRHIGAHNAISMTALYREVFGRPVRHLVNDAKRLRELVDKLRVEGEPICSLKSTQGGGYYLPQAGAELDDFLRREKSRALRVLAKVAKIKRVALPELLGQMAMEME